MKIHLDTDIGGDTDDLCALVMLLKWPGLEIVGVTTVTEDQGRRAGYVDYVLKIAGRSDIPIAAGADVADGYYRFKPGYPVDKDNWPDPVPSRPGPVGAALELLKQSIEQGAVIVGIGQFTNFRLLDDMYPGILEQAKLYLMGGFVYDIPQGFPQWDNDMDYNIQLDVPSAQYVIEHANPTIIPMTVTCQTALRRAYLPRLAQAGRLGELIVRQAEVHAATHHNEQDLAPACPKLPGDIINFQHDPLACAIALGWNEGVEIDMVPLKLENRDGWLYEIPDKNGRFTRLVTKIDGDAFNEYWYDMVCQ